MDPYSNEELFRGIKNRDEEVLGYIIKRYKPAVRVMIRNLGGSHENANDIFHDALMEIFEKIVNNAFPLKGKLENFLFVICRNKWRDQIRKRKSLNNYYSTLILNYDYVDPGFNIDMDLYKDALQKSIENLGELCRNIITLVLEGKSQKEVAGLLKKNYDYIRRRYHDCMKKLKELARMAIGEQNEPSHENIN